MAQTSICSLCSLFYDSLQRFLQNHLGFTTLVLPFYDLQEMIHPHIVAICESDILHTEGAHVSNATPKGKYKGRQPSPPRELLGFFQYFFINWSSTCQLSYSS